MESESRYKRPCWGRLHGGQGCGTETLYLLGHFESDIGAELEHLTHLFRGGWDQGNFLNGS